MLIDFLKLFKEATFLIEAGSLFQSAGAAAAKERAPSVGSTENDFSENNRARNTLNEWSFSCYFENNFIYRSWKTLKILEKVMESHGIL